MVRLLTLKNKAIEYKLISESTTKELEASINAAAAEGWELDKYAEVLSAEQWAGTAVMKRGRIHELNWVSFDAYLKEVMRIKTEVRKGAMSSEYVARINEGVALVKKFAWHEVTKANKQ